MGAVSSASDTNTFFNEVAAIQNDITSLEQNITQIEELHDVSLNSVSSEDHTVQRKLEQVTADTTQLSNRIKKSIKGRLGQHTWRLVLLMPYE
ncbi:hypothetical protein BGZ99_000720 [Dissophora globulifera]|uniref:Syntaxin n=1 Tax=Dissophora globulifera TaxID=979702 RepID=A0A9P6UK20_9FUNG|nr:hypothetical protein BGZ99_000720 [Dissophora globulifera]